MKIIVSSKNFQKITEKAISGIYTKITFNKDDIKIIDDRGSKTRFLKIEGFECLSFNKCFSVRFDYFKFVKMNNILSMIPEQPIVIEFDDYGYDELKMEISQFVATF